jgi:hypothetical protein
MTDAVEQRRRARETRRAVVTGPWELPRNGSHGDWRSEITSRSAQLRARLPGAPAVRAVSAGAAAGVLAGLLAAGRKARGKDGNVVSGEVAVHLLNRIELLNVRLQLRHAHRTLPTRIDVHHVSADASAKR